MNRRYPPGGGWGGEGRFPSKLQVSVTEPLLRSGTLPTWSGDLGGFGQQPGDLGGGGRGRGQFRRQGDHVTKYWKTKI